MINLSEIARNSELSLRGKRVAFLDPEIYIMDNVKDYKLNLKKLKNPFWKNNPFLESNYYCAISIYNLGIDFIEKNYFKLHDETGEIVVYWAEKNKGFPGIETYEECVKNQGLKQEDWIYKIQLRYIFPNLPTVNFIQKNEKRKIREKELESFFPEIVPAFSY